VTILCGTFGHSKHQALTNHTLPVAKYFIYEYFLNEEPLDFELYKLLLREKALAEKHIAFKNNSFATFNKKWQPLVSKNFITCTV